MANKIVIIMRLYMPPAGFSRDFVRWWAIHMPLWVKTDGTRDAIKQTKLCQPCHPCARTLRSFDISKLQHNAIATLAEGSFQGLKALADL